MGIHKKSNLGKCLEELLPPIKIEGLLAKTKPPWEQIFRILKPIRYGAWRLYETDRCHLESGAAKIGHVIASLEEKRNLIMPPSEKISDQNQLFVITHGTEGVRKVSYALAQASHAAAYGRKVMVFFVSDGFIWGLADFAKPFVDPCFGNVHDLLTNLSGLGARLVVCRTCYDTLDRQGIEETESGIHLGNFSEVQKFLEQPSVVFSY